MPSPFHAGQRWVSESEPELGLGSVAQLTERTVILVFAATGQRREYAQQASPLRRVQFHPGETLSTTQAFRFQVATVTQRQELLYYGWTGGEVCETELSPSLHVSTPLQRMLAGQFDAPASFKLRLRALARQYHRRRSPLRGLLGGRIELIPHQLAIAAQVAERLVPRVLLADEVGLGKTIEACLILHRLHLTGRAQRVLILVPDSLVHQWFLELMRRFNLWFHLFDEERCAALEAAAPGSNPFQDDQLVLCGLSLFAQPNRLEQALAAGWELLVVDEAHHLGWSEQGPSPEYAAVERLAAATPGLLLLTATPEQLGLASHFARLRLLDPARFASLAEYRRQAAAFGAVAVLAEGLLGTAPLPPLTLAELARFLGEEPSALAARLEQPEARRRLLGELLDQHGTGRVMFRNTRAGIQGFPQRVAHLVSLPVAAEDPQRLKALAREFEADAAAEGPSFRGNLAQDPRLLWLVRLLSQPEPDKLLLICRSRAKAEAIEAALAQHLKVKVALFHEGLTLVQRDRGAAWFAEPRGARLLICSEIGSEGRNFQFAHHLVLFDLPLDPALLEQRIGRLDRIGQRAEIQVYVPTVLGSPQEGLARWYHEGLNAFTRNLAGGQELLEQFRPRLLRLATGSADLEPLLQETQAACLALELRLEAGRDRLLELNTLGRDGAEGSARLVTAIQAQDAEPTLEAFLLATFEQFFIPVEEVAARTYQLGSMEALADAFPGLPAEGLTVTCDRQRALAREDLQFLTWDHPLVTGALDLLLGSPQGNCAFARWPDPKLSGLYLEAIYLVECLAPPQLHADRFLAPTPVRVVVDHAGRDLSQALPTATLTKVLGTQGGAELPPRPEWLETRLPPMARHAETLALRLVPALVAKARAAMTEQLTQEWQRLQVLSQHGGVRAEELQALLDQRQALDEHLAGARVRLDALRLIARG